MDDPALLRTQTIRRDKKYPGIPFLSRPVAKISYDRADETCNSFVSPTPIVIFFVNLRMYAR